MEDLDGWEVLPDNGFLQIHDDGGQKIFSRKYGSRNLFKNYFICPDSKSTKFVETTEQQQHQETEEEETEHYYKSRVVPKRFVPVTLIQVEDQEEEELKKIIDIPFEKVINPIELDQDPVSQVVLFKPEFVDMKLLESPARSMKPPPIPVDDAAFQLGEGKGEIFDMKITTSPRSLILKGEEVRQDISHDGVWEEHNSSSASGDDGGFNLWKWSLTGIGAICSFSVAAATVCIIFIGTQQRNTKQQYNENHKLQFHVYADDKGLKEAVRNATKLKEAVSAMRGSAPPMSRGVAHITFGGYYEEAL